MSRRVPSRPRSIREKIEGIKDMPWYHPTMSRNTAEVLLLSNGVEGNFLIRPSRSNAGNFAVSVRSLNCVKHFPLVYDGHVYKFGVGVFSSIQELVEHFDNYPVIGGQSGTPIVLRYPYFRDIAEPSFYSQITRHALAGKSFNCCGMDLSGTESGAEDLSIASKEGFLTKLGEYHKNWKRRWFVTNRCYFQYFKQRGDQKSLRTLDLRMAQEIEADETCGKPNAFRLKFPDRTFYMFADSKREMEEWLLTLKWKLSHLKRQDRGSEQKTSVEGNSRTRTRDVTDWVYLLKNPDPSPYNLTI